MEGLSLNRELTNIMRIRTSTILRAITAAPKRIDRKNFPGSKRTFFKKTVKLESSGKKATPQRPLKFTNESPAFL